MRAELQRGTGTSQSDGNALCLDYGGYDTGVNIYQNSSNYVLLLYGKHISIKLIFFKAMILKIRFHFKNPDSQLLLKN